MRFCRHGRPDPEVAERLLDGVVDEYTGSRSASRAPADRLADLLTVAAAPARSEELAGEEAAVAAFRAARIAAERPAALAASEAATRAVPAGTSSGPAAGSRRRLTLGAGGWIAVGVATLTAGVALAAEIPALKPAGPPPVPAPVDTGDTSPTAPAPTTTPAGPAGAPAPSLSGQVHPPESIVGQCHALLAKGGPKPDPPAGQSPSAALARAAGGPAEVEDYCRRLLATDSKPGKARPSPGRNDSTGNSRPTDSAEPGGERAPVDPPSQSPNGEHSGNVSR